MQDRSTVGQESNGTTVPIEGIISVHERCFYRWKNRQNLILITRFIMILEVSKSTCSFTVQSMRVCSIYVGVGK